MKKNIKKYLSVLFLGLALAGCTKNEFMPPPEGEPIPYQPESNQTLYELLEASSYQLFYKAFQRSSMDSILSGKFKYTLLVPTDAALQAGGYTASRIDAMTVIQADSLVKFYTLRGVISKETLSRVSGNLASASFLSNPKYVQTPYFYGNEQPGNTQFDVYFYRHYLYIDQNKLLINAIPSGDVEKAVPAVNGYIWPIDQLVSLPIEADFYSVARTDPRFSMFFELQTRVDEIHDLTYRRIYEENFGFDPGGWGWVDWTRTQYARIKSFQSYNGDKMSVSREMMFIPVNEAFLKAGFNSVEEILQMDQRNAAAPIVDFDYWEVTLGFPSDSILSFHWDFGRDNLPKTPSGKVQGSMATNFFVNDLRDEYLYDYSVNHASGYPPYKMPFTFGKNEAGKRTVKVKNSNFPEATILETIHTIMGPIHVVDRLLIPKDLKIN
jgi:hypothetical protein